MKKLKPLRDNVIQLWICNTREFQDKELLSHYQFILSQEELRRYRRFHFDQHRHTFLVSHAMVRTVLSYYSTLVPSEWIFCNNEHGKPEIIPSQNPQGIQFSLSHSGNIAVCAVCRQREVGADVETIVERKQLNQIANRFFSPQETKELFSQPPSKQSRRFFDYWTLKESYIKAIGKGLTIPLDRFSFKLNTPDDINLEIHDPSLQEDKQWFFRLMNNHNEYTVAVCAENPSQTATPIIIVEKFDAREQTLQNERYGRKFILGH